MEIPSVGPFIIGKTLGQGTTGKVKLGFHKNTGFKVGIKIINKELLINKPSMRRKIEREIVLMKLIDHPNAMKMYEVYETSKYLFLILEYVEGGELFDYLVEKGGLESGEALYFFQQIIIGLEYCHSRNICHRDLKPENLLLSGDKRIKIADFGMGSIVRKDMLLHTSCGSPHYASPEVVSGIDYDGQKADVWSCGVILYALLTGKLPFDDENIRRLLNKVKNGAFSMPPYIHKDAQDLLTRMLTVDPSKRISIKEIKEHPWFTSNHSQFQKASPVEEINADPLIDQSQIDDDIFRSLMALGLGSAEEVKQQLVSNQKHVSLIYYRLLEERKKFDSDVNKYGYKPKEARRNSLSEISLKRIFNGSNNNNNNNNNNSNNNSSNNSSSGSKSNDSQPVQPQFIQQQQPPQAHQQSPSNSSSQESMLTNSGSSSSSIGSGVSSSGSSGSFGSNRSEGLLKQALQQHHQQQQQHQQVQQHSPQYQPMQIDKPSSGSVGSSSSSPVSSTSSSASTSPQLQSVKPDHYQRRGSMTATTNPATSPTMSHRGKTSSPIEITSKVRKLKISESGGGTPGSPIIGSSPKKSWFSYFFSKGNSSNNLNNNNHNNNNSGNHSQASGNFVIDSKIDVNLIYVNLEKIIKKYGYEWRYQQSAAPGQSVNHCFIRSHSNNHDGTPQFECEIEIKPNPIGQPILRNNNSNNSIPPLNLNGGNNNNNNNNPSFKLQIIHKSGSLHKFNNFTSSLEQILTN
ncbi:hypothetical protein DICPUDRAFT_49516 [Dictyostelium purpureum]|uniref:Protein kinase domain-containing protein n=1 Tax=Dictyostelium purpureum TaxID=5786 RepID=F0ZU01_DICPU|nr:uncharacterized protein DICPUDRAFT_49516 [Dictyostelium purpureum]EGC32558.1 hypothetical protein DICPUDRAFT_49516 [Dictyostelium purpureum]|eukprot:XP_003290895.1 hypothetical protein DICPUDRAFT_49516 [Dictyostelium purpureum]